MNNDKWICHLCGKELSRKQTLKTHLSCIHGESVSPAKKKYKVYELNPFAEIPKSTNYRWKIHNSHNTLVTECSVNEATSAPGVNEDECDVVELEDLNDGPSADELDENQPDTCISNKIKGNHSEDFSDDQYNWENTMDICDISSSDESERQSSDSEPDLDLNSETNDELHSPPLFVLPPSNKVFKSNITHHEHMLAVNALSSSGNLSSLVLENVLDLIRLHLPNKNLCEGTVGDIKKKLGFSKDYLTTFEYCNICGAFFTDDNDRSCKTVGCSGSRSNMNYFVVGDVKQQIKEVLERKGNWRKIKDELNRPKTTLSPIVDITSGSEYTKLVVDGGFLNESNNITLTFNTDGVSLFKSTNVNLWPVYLAINELPPKERFLVKNMIIWGIWQGPSKPVMDIFMSQFVREMVQLEREGVHIRVEDKEFQCCAKLVLGTMDLPARASVLNTTHHNGAYSCIYCEISGNVVKSGNGYARSFPFIEPPAKKRNEESINRDINEAVQSGKTVKGFFGRCSVGCLPDFYPFKNIAVDYMHACLAGITKRLIQLFTNGTSFKENYFIGHKVPVIDKELKRLCVPYHINRKPRRLSIYSKWKSSEFRSWLLYYSIPCLANHLPEVYLKHFSCLVEGIYILLQSSVTEVDICQAEELLKSFYKHASTLYGDNFVGLNVHNLSHLPECVRKWGPLWAYSCFGFESANGEMLKNVHGKKNVCAQVFWALQAQKRLELEKECLPEGPVKDFLKKTLAIKSIDTLLDGFQCQIYPQLANCHPGDVSESIQEQINNHLGRNSGNTDLRKAVKIKRNGFVFFSKQCQKVKSTNSYTISLEKTLDGSEIVQIEYFLVHQPTMKVFCVCHILSTSQLKHPRCMVNLKMVTNKRGLVAIPATLLKEHVVFMTVGGQSYIATFPNFVERD